MRVDDEAGNAIAGLTVTWSVASGGGSVDGASAATAANGEATTNWTLGGVAGAQTVTASGSLTMATTNSVLPANSDGDRNPAVYQVTGNVSSG